MKMTPLKMTFLTFLLLSTAALAHEGHDHGGAAENKIMGVVKAITATAVTVTDTHGTDVNIAIISDTKFERAGKAATAQDAVVGSRVVIETMGTPDSGGLHAMKVKIGAAAKPRKSVNATAQRRSPLNALEKR